MGVESKGKKGESTEVPTKDEQNKEKVSGI